MTGATKDTIYRRLARHLDNLPGGFPPTESGVELRILKRIFTPEEAALTPLLGLIPESAKVVALRAKLTVEETSRRLEEMSRKGLILKTNPPVGKPLYLAAQYVLGIWELQVGRLDRELAADMDEYIPVLFREAWKKPQLRTVPVGKSVHGELKIATYERAENIVEDSVKFALSPCICLLERRLAGEGCDKPEYCCICFDSIAEMTVAQGHARFAEKSEILELLKKADELGLVLQPGASQKTDIMCCCCGCCCGVLTQLKKMPEPAGSVSSPFMSVVDSDKCIGCGKCTERCPMDAVVLEEKKAKTAPLRCIGCGLCVTTCPTGAIRLERKTGQRDKIPYNIVSATFSHGRARGKLKNREITRMLLKAAIDRFEAAVCDKFRIPESEASKQIPGGKSVCRSDLFFRSE